MTDTKSQPDILVVDLNKSYITANGPLEVVRSVSFNVGRGKILCLIGPSGCGKSTILRILAGLENDENNSVKLLQERAKRSAFLPQTPVLLPWRTVLQNASLGAEIRTAKIDTGDVTRVRRELDTFGLSDFSDYLAGDLSGGMKQRLSIARALSSEPHILFCDEPFSSIDYVARFDLNTKFKRYCRDYGITCVFVTHNIEEAIFLADTIVVLSSRPCRIINTHHPSLTIDKENAYGCRRSPEFDPLFRAIWEELQF